MAIYSLYVVLNMNLCITYYTNNNTSKYIPKSLKQYYRKIMELQHNTMH